MTEPTYRVRAASVQGVKHVQNGINNQDAQQVHEFAVPKWERTFRIGFVSDGCSGIPAFSRSEVGANLTVTYCVARVQQLILGGAELKEIPLLLYHSLTSYLHAVASLTMPANVHWVYPVNFSGSRAFRNDMSSTDRFLFDYLMATVIGYIDDGTTLVTFRIGDGVMIVNDDVIIADEDDAPSYPALMRGFKMKSYASEEVGRLALATDGIEELLKLPGLGLPAQLFDHNAQSPLGLKALLVSLCDRYPSRVSDDLTVVTRERIGGDQDEELTGS